MGLKWTVGVAASAWLALAFGCGDETTIVEEGDTIITHERSPLVTVNTTDLLVSALAVALPGDTITVLSGTYEGPLLVPGGVNVVGAGVGETVIAGHPGAPALMLAPGARSVEVSDLTVEADGDYGLFAEGVGRVSLHDIEVQVLRGAGIGVDAVSSITMTDIEVVGTVTSDNALDYPFDPGADTASTRGVVVVDVPDAAIMGLDVTGMATVGVLLVDSETTWEGGSATANLGGNLFVQGGSAELSMVELSSALNGVSLSPAYGAAFVDTEVSTDGASVMDNEGVGILAVRSQTRHVDLDASANLRAALWIQDSDATELMGGTLTGNHMGGIIAIESSGLLVDGTAITDTVATQLVVGDSPVDVGDGLQLRLTQGTTLRNVSLMNNARVGLLVDAGEESFDVTLENVSVEGTGEQLGAVATGESVPADWDAEVTRAGDVATTDAAFGGELRTLDPLVPNELPRGAAETL